MNKDSCVAKAHAPAWVTDDSQERQSLGGVHCTQPVPQQVGEFG